LVEPRTITLTSRAFAATIKSSHSPMLSENFGFLEKKSQMVRRDFSPVVPETFTMVDGLQVPLSEISVRFPRGVRFVCNACGAARETKH